MQKAKNKKRNSFDRKHYVDNVEVKEDSDWVQYYLENPENYPEITK